MPEYKGIDVSKWNGSIDFNKVKAAGIDFVMIRAGYGKLISQKDNKFEINYTNAKAAGLKVGAYWYSYADTVAAATAEAAVFLKVINGKTFEYPVAFDIEEEDQYNLGAAMCSEIANTFCSTVEKAGYYCLLYSYETFLANRISDAVKSKYALWCANTSRTPALKYAIHQYSFKGSVNGVNGDVDLNKSLYDYKKIITDKGLNGLKAATVTTPTTPAAATTTPTTTNIKAGQLIKLVNANLYVSATATTAVAKKTGNYYIYSAEKINGRYRVTTAAANAGKTPASKYVTGWVNATVTTPAAATTTPTTTNIKAGQLIKLVNANLYVSATATTAAAKKTGNYYIYSAEKINGRYRVTTAAANAGKTPTSKYVTGWVSKSDIK